MTVSLELVGVPSDSRRLCGTISAQPHSVGARPRTSIKGANWIEIDNLTPWTWGYFGVLFAPCSIVRGGAKENSN